MAFIDEILSYARIYETGEEIQPLVDAAEAYVTGAMECKDAEINRANPLYCLAVKLLVSHWYDNREPVGQTNRIAYGLEAILAQLQNGSIS